MRSIIAITLLTLSPLVGAEVFKCEVNGKTEYSDKPCAANAQTIEIEVYKPKVEDIETQKRLTETYQQDSKYQDLLDLRKQNKTLQKQIERLHQQRDAELKTFESKIYRYSDTQVATSEHGLFKKMRQISADYQAKIQQLEDKVKRNNSKMSTIDFTNE